jgi:hypothetical protein
MKNTSSNADFQQRTRLKVWGRCPFPGCALPVEHDADHLPPYRLIQRFKYPLGTCEYCSTPGCADALLASFDDRGLAVCSVCEDELMSIGKAVAA